MKGFLIATAVFALLLAGGAGYFLLFKTQDAEIGLEFSKPAQVLLGEPFTVAVSIANYSDKIVKNAKFGLSLPDGVAFVGQEAGQRVQEQSLGDLGPGSLNQQSVNLIVIKDSQSVKRLEAKVTYETEAARARFESRREIDVAVGQPALDLRVNLPEKILSGEKVLMRVQYRNQGKQAIKGATLTMTYPPFFKFDKSSVPPEKGNAVWDLGTLDKNIEGVIEIEGEISGPGDSIAAFEAALTGEFLGENYVINRQAGNLAISGSPLQVSVLLNGRADTFLHIGEVARYTFVYQNNSDTGFENATVRATFTSDVFDFGDSVSNASLNSITNTFTWNPATTPALALISPGESGSLSVEIPLKTAYPIRRLSDRNFILKVKAEIQSPTVPPGTAAEKTFSSGQLETKVAGKLDLKSLGYFRDAPSGILNTGPYPPKANQPTQYTIHWVITNYATDVSGVKISANLQSGTRFTGKVKSNVATQPTYNAASGEVSWAIPAIGATRGVISPPIEAIFQIENTPAVNQVGQAVTLLGDTKIEAMDDFVKFPIQATIPAITTDLPSDTTVAGQDKRVQ